MPISNLNRLLRTSFLEFVCKRLLGPPAKHGGSMGESYWCCPFHNDEHPSFHTLPTKVGMREYWKCFGCDSYGDVYQLVRNLRELGHPECGGNWPQHEARVEQWKREWMKLNASTEINSSGTTACPTCGAKVFHSVEALSWIDRQHAAEERELKYADSAWADLTDAERLELVRLKDKVNDDVSLDVLAKVCRDYQESFKRSERLHRAECKDPNCEARVCQMARENLNGTER